MAENLASKITPEQKVWLNQLKKVILSAPTSVMGYVALAFVEQGADEALLLGRAINTENTTAIREILDTVWKDPLRGTERLNDDGESS